MNVTDVDNGTKFASLAKDLEKLKFELQDIIDSKFEYIVKSIETQTKQLKANYDELSGHLRKTGNELNDNFKEKVVNVKSMVATFFAKVDTQLKEANKKTAEIDAYFRRFEANFVNP